MGLTFAAQSAPRNHPLISPVRSTSCRGWRKKEWT